MATFTISEITIIHSNVTNCSTKCDLTYDYGNTSGETSYDLGANYIVLANSYAPSQASYAMIYFKSAQYDVNAVYFTPPCHTFPSPYSRDYDAEIVIQHTKKGDESQKLYIHVPVLKSSIQNSASVFALQTIYGGIDQANDDSKAYSVSYTLNDLVPKPDSGTPFYIYDDSSGAHHVVFVLRNNNIIVDTTTYTNLVNLLGADKFFPPTTETTPSNVYFNSKGANQSNGQIYIKCSPTGVEASGSKATVAKASGTKAVAAQSKTSKKVLEGLVSGFAILAGVLFVVIVWWYFSKSGGSGTQSGGSAIQTGGSAIQTGGAMQIDVPGFGTGGTYAGFNGISERDALTFVGSYAPVSAFSKNVY